MSAIRQDAFESPESPEEPPESGLLRRAASPVVNTWGRPSGWLGWWSERYAHVIDRYLFPRRPFEATELTHALAAAPPMPFAEVFDPVASVGEPRSRDGQLLPWRFARSATLDLFGNWGVAFGALTVGLVVLNFVISHAVVQPPKGKEDAPVQIDAPRGGETAAPSCPVNPTATDILPNAIEQRPLNPANPANPARSDPGQSDRKDQEPILSPAQAQPQQQQQQPPPPSNQIDRKSTIQQENLRATTGPGGKTPNPRPIDEKPRPKFPGPRAN